MLAGIIGVGLIALAIRILGFASPTTSEHTSSTSPGPTAAVPSPAAVQQQNIPAERYKELAGTWSVTEKVQPKFGGYEIIWTYKAEVVGRQLTLHGKKTVVNEPGQAQLRKLTPEEKHTDSLCILFLTGLQAEGSFEETSPTEKIAGTVKLHLSEDLHSFAGTAETGGEETSTFMGARK